MLLWNKVKNEKYKECCIKKFYSIKKSLFDLNPISSQDKVSALIKYGMKVSQNVASL